MRPGWELASDQGISQQNPQFCTVLHGVRPWPAVWT